VSSADHSPLPSPPPIPFRTLRWRSRAAGHAGGSPGSSPQFLTSSGRAPGSPLGPYSSLTVFQTQDAPCQSASQVTQPTASLSGTRCGTSLPLETGLELGPDSPTVEELVDKEDPMDVGNEQALANAIHALMAKISGLTRDKAETWCDEAKGKIDAATLDSAIVAALLRDFQSDICDFLNGYCTQVETLASAHSSLEKLCKHRSAKTFPMSLNSIKVLLTQFSHAYLQAPEADANWGRYALPQGGSAVFAMYIEKQVQHLKSEILKNWVSEKEQEVHFLESWALAIIATGQFEEVVDARHASLKAWYNHLDRQPRYCKIIRDVDFMGVVSHSLASGVIAKVNSLVHAEEDCKLATALKKMDLNKPAVAAAAQAPPNDNAELKKIVLDLGKKVNLLSKKVHDYLFCLLCACADLLSLSPPLLKQLLVDLVEAGWEEARWKETSGKARQGSAHRKEKGQEDRSC